MSEENKAPVDASDAFREMLSKDQISTEKMQSILDAGDNFTPRVVLSVFEEKVLPLLATPFDTAAVNKYLEFVGQYFNPLIVVDDNDHSRQIYRIPPLFSTPNTVIRSVGSTSPMNVMRHMANGGGSRVKDPTVKYANMLYETVSRGSTYELVIRPILFVLKDYNMKMKIPVGDGFQEIDPSYLNPEKDNVHRDKQAAATAAKTNKPIVDTSAFEDEDDD